MSVEVLLGANAQQATPQTHQPFSQRAWSCHSTHLRLSAKSSMAGSVAAYCNGCEDGDMALIVKQVASKAYALPLLHAAAPTALTLNSMTPQLIMVPGRSCSRNRGCRKPDVGSRQAPAGVHVSVP